MKWKFDLANLIINENCQHFYLFYQSIQCKECLELEKFPHLIIHLKQLRYWKKNLKMWLHLGDFIWNRTLLYNLTPIFKLNRFVILWTHLPREVKKISKMIQICFIRSHVWITVKMSRFVQINSFLLCPVCYINRQFYNSLKRITFWK